MPGRIELNLPTYMGAVRDAEVVALTLNAYLLGSRARQNVHGSMGPYRQDDKWQLDESNDYWLHLDGEQLSITYRYSEKKAAALAALFHAMFDGP